MSTFFQMSATLFVAWGVASCSPTVDSGSVADQTPTTLAPRIEAPTSGTSTTEDPAASDTTDETTPESLDADTDGLADAVDNCPDHMNVDQADFDHDGQGDACDSDDDNDGEPDVADAFPFNVSEQTDTDGDGLGDHADTDDDNDTWTDIAENVCGTSPDDATSVPDDMDADGNCDLLDDDIDGDGWDNATETACLSSYADVTSVPTDTDSDGTCDELDADDDNDGEPDVSDVFPLNPAEQSDTDGDGLGDNADTDDNGDGILDPEHLSFQNPIIHNDDHFVGSHWNDPHVIYDNRQLVMYASSDISWDGYVRIYRLTSPDGVAWTLSPTDPVFERATSGWDSHGTETPAVVVFQGEYHLFYTGYDVTYDYASDGTDGVAGTFDDDSASKHFRIGHATSSDGINFVRQGVVVAPTAPYLAPNLDFNQYVVGEPAPVVFNDSLYLYFTAMGADLEVNSTSQVIGLTIFDGSTWDTPRATIKPDQSIYPRTTYLGYSTPNAIVIGGSIHLYFDVAEDAPFRQAKLHHASSIDGESDWIQDDTPLKSSEEAAWTASEVRSPSVVTLSDTLYLYYAGHTTTPAIDLGIGLELLPLP